MWTPAVVGRCARACGIANRIPAAAPKRHARAPARQKGGPNHLDLLLLDGKGVERIPGPDDEILLTVEHVRLRPVADTRGEARVPQDLAIRRIVRNQMFSAVSGEQQVSGRGQDADRATAGWVLMGPDCFAGLVIDRLKRSTIGPRAALSRRIPFGM